MKRGIERAIKAVKPPQRSAKRDHLVVGLHEEIADAEQSVWRQEAEVTIGLIRAAIRIETNERKVLIRMAGWVCRKTGLYPKFSADYNFAIGLDANTAHRKRRLVIQKAKNRKPRRVKR